MKTKAKLPSTAVGRRRLLKLAALLIADAKRKRGIKFDLDVIAMRSTPIVVNRDWGDFETRDFQPGDRVTIDCGTTACAWGLAALSGAFKRERLRYVIDSSGFTPIYRECRDMQAAEAFFHLSEDEMEFLFVPDRYRRLPIKGAKGERAVAKRIRDFVAGRARPI